MKILFMVLLPRVDVNGLLDDIIKAYGVGENSDSKEERMFDNKNL